MDADKTNGIEPFGKLVQRGPVQQLLSADVQVRINSSSLDPLDIGHPYNEALLPSGPELADGDPEELVEQI